MSARDPHAAAPRWRPVAPGAWLREPPQGGVSALVQARGGRFVMRVDGGPWLDAGATLLAATEHAGGHAVRLELMAQRGGQDLVGPCVICARMGAKEGGR